MSALVAAIVSGTAELKVGSWLDGLEEVFSVDGPGRDEALAGFGRCMSEKEIFRDG